MYLGCPCWLSSPSWFYVRWALPWFMCFSILAVVIIYLLQSTYHTCRRAPFLCEAAPDIVYHVWMQESEKPSTGQRGAYRMIKLLCPIDVVWQAGVSLFHLILCWCPPFVIHVQYILAFILTARVISFANIYIAYTRGLLCHVGCNQQTRQRKYFSFRFCILNLPPIYHLSSILSGCVSFVLT
jgi:hypothetical protein